MYLPTNMKNKVSRRKFVQSLALAGSSVSLLSFSNISIIDRAITNTPLRLSESRFLKVELNKDSPGFSTLSLDSLGGSKFTLSPITSQSSENRYRTSVKRMKSEYL